MAEFVLPAGDFYLPVGRAQYRDIIVEMYRDRGIDYWEAWKRLYNEGWRGPDLRLPNG
jgi:hypothetical protein